MKSSPFLHYFLFSKAQNPKIMLGTTYQNYFFMLANDMNNFLRKLEKILLTLNTISNQYDNLFLPMPETLNLYPECHEIKL